MHVLPAHILEISSIVFRSKVSSEARTRYSFVTDFESFSDSKLCGVCRALHCDEDLSACCIYLRHVAAAACMPGSAIRQPGMCLCSEVAGVRVAPPFWRKLCFTGSLHSPLLQVIFLLSDYLDDNHYHCIIVVVIIGIIKATRQFMTMATKFLIFMTLAGDSTERIKGWWWWWWWWWGWRWRWRWWWWCWC